MNCLSLALTLLAAGSSSSGDDVTTIRRPPSEPRNPHYVGNRAPLVSTPLIPLPIGAIEPRGWLRKQLRLQADGLSGHLHEFWPKIRDSEWIGGDYRLGWESVAIWLDGVVPLAFLLDDESLKRVVARYITCILDHCRARRRFSTVITRALAWPRSSAQV